MGDKVHLAHDAETRQACLASASPCLSTGGRLTCDVSTIMAHALFQIIFLLAVANPAVSGKLQDEKVYTVSEVTVKPQPQEGLEDFKTAWSKEVTYPELAIQKNIQGMVFIAFIIDADGSVRDASVTSGLGYGCDEAALKGFREVTKEAWRPGMKNGEAVKVKMVMPFFFRITKR